MRAILSWVVLATVVPTITAAQSAGDREAGQAVIIQWLGLVANGAADQAWEQASPLFQYRISQSAWRDWVRAASAKLGAAGARREVEMAVGHDEPPLDPLDWIRVTYARTRPQGGRVFEQIILLNENGYWRVSHYGAWCDGGAVVSGGSLFPVPYELAYRGQLTFREFPWRVRMGRPHGPGAPAPPPPPVTVVNPRTFPKRPPPR